MIPRKRNLLFACTIVLGVTATFLLSLPATAQASNTAPDVAAKKTIAVGAFESAETLGGTTTGAGLSAMLTDALVNDGRFVVVERAALSDVQGEQQLGTQGATTSATAPKAGQLLGARLLVRGTVTIFNPQASGGTLNVGGPANSLSGLASTVGVNDTTAEVEIAIRLIDMTTGQILYAGTARGSASAKGFNAQLYSKSGFGIGGTAFQSTPLGEAAQDAIKDLVAKLALAVAKIP